MGNAGASYALARVYGAPASVLISVAAEGYCALGNRSWTPDGALGSFKGNYLGLKEYTREEWNDAAAFPVGSTSSDRMAISISHQKIL